MVCFQTKPPSFGTFWKAFERIILISFILFGHLLHFMAIWYLLWAFFILYYPHFGKLYHINLATQILETTPGLCLLLPRISNNRIF
jgi:hypothetical protein